jgi:aspartate carbamoyltransferase catalytic subunit
MTPAQEAMILHGRPGGGPSWTHRPRRARVAQPSPSDALRMLPFPHRHLLAIEGLEPPYIADLLDLAESYALLNRQGKTQRDLLKGRTLINLFFEDSTRTRTSFELAGKRLGADIVNMSVSTSSVNKGETLLDTASTLNAMQTDLLVIRHGQSGAPALLAQKVDAAVINAGDGTHEHPTQALLDALTIRRHKGQLEGLTVAICGDVLHSRVARSNIHLLLAMNSRVRIVGPPTLIPAEAARLGVEVHHSMRTGLADADVVMMLRLQKERMTGGLVPSAREFFRFYGLDAEKLAWAKPDAIVMHPGPMNRGVEIDSAVADDPVRSVIGEQVEMGVAVRMAVLDTLARNQRRNT